MREEIAQGVLHIAARELGVSRERLNELTYLKPEAWFQIAIVCDALLVKEDFIHWQRPTADRQIRDIIESIYAHTQTYSTTCHLFASSFSRLVEA